MTAFVLGNGISRKGIDLYALKKHGKIYGCNALYREFEPDVLVSTDPGISKEIQESGWPTGRRHYTRKPFSNSASIKLEPAYKGMSSGPNALNIACKDEHTTIFLLGFDLGSVDQRFNNLYADSPFYKKSTDGATFGGNWLNQIIQIMNENPTIQFYRVVTRHSQGFADKLAKVKNLQEMTKEQFQNTYK